MTEVLFYEKPGCVNNTRQKAVLRALGHVVIARNLLQEPWTFASLRPYCGARPVSQWFNPSSPRIKSGELHPELFIGGYDGTFSYDAPIIDPNNPNPPMLANAPQPPYLRQLMTDLPGVDHAICMGLAEDMIGYIVPSYNYQLDDNTPYIEEAPGDHYEETNSVGPQVEEQAVGSMRDLIEWQP